jgi:hypothetical protein
MIVVVYMDAVGAAILTCQPKNDQAAAGMGENRCHKRGFSDKI